MSHQVVCLFTMFRRENRWLLLRIVSMRVLNSNSSNNLISLTDLGVWKSCWLPRRVSAHRLVIFYYEQPRSLRRLSFVWVTTVEWKAGFLFSQSSCEFAMPFSGYLVSVHRFRLTQFLRDVHWHSWNVYLEHFRWVVISTLVHLNSIFESGDFYFQTNRILAINL